MTAWGYCRSVSVLAGESLTLCLSSSAPQLRIDFYRRGAELELVERGCWLNVPNTAKGDAHSDWGWPEYHFQVPRAWRSGVYVADLVEGDHSGRLVGGQSPHSSYAPSGKVIFVVRAIEDAPSRILYQVPMLTYVAYDREGGCSLYGCDCSPKRHDVTLRRAGIAGGGQNHDDGVPDVYDRASPRQTFEHWEAKFIAWLEQAGFVADYCTDLDLLEHRHLLQNRALLISVGHDEYWPEAKRAAVESFVRGGGNLAVFGGNTCYWHATVAEGRVSCDRERDRCGDEERLLGASYRFGGGWWGGPREPQGYEVVAPEHWVFADTGLTLGSGFGGRGALVGYECDGAPMVSSAAQVLARARLGRRGDGSDGWQCELESAEAAMTIRRDGGTVFSASTCDWARLLAEDAVVRRITHNVVRRLSS